MIVDQVTELIEESCLAGSRGENKVVLVVGVVLSSKTFPVETGVHCCMFYLIDPGRGQSSPHPSSTPSLLPEPSRSISSKARIDASTVWPHPTENNQTPPTLPLTTEINLTNLLAARVLAMTCHLVSNPKVALNHKNEVEQTQPANTLIMTQDI